MTKEQITELLQPYLEDDRIFIVEVKVSEGKIRQTITILLDTDGGIQIDRKSVV